MANVAGTISVPGGTTVELFAELGISPGRVTVSLHSDAGSPPVVLVGSAKGTSTAFALPDSEGTALQFITDRDQVYLANLSGSALNVYVYLSAV